KYEEKCDSIMVDSEIEIPKEDKDEKVISNNGRGNKNKKHTIKEKLTI
ncbi:hypothetical protein PMALA_075010, partial [Plasmodium malariae]